LPFAPSTPPPRAILFIDDIHTITGPNAQQGGGVMDASVMLKPLLSRWVARWGWAGGWVDGRVDK